MKLHVLPGDAYVEAFEGTNLEGDVAVFRECLVEGDLWGPSLEEFWRTREHYLSANYPAEGKSYETDVAAEIEKMLAPGAGDEIYLWFEYELFCSVNYWFCLDLLRDSFATIYRVSPTVRDEQTRWRGFGKLDPEHLLECWAERVQLSSEDVEHGSELWQAFKTGNRFRLDNLGSYDSPAFPYLNEVAAAAVDIENGLAKVLKEISSHGSDDFRKVFEEFGRRAGVYGLGDVQVRRIWDDLRGGA